MAYEFKTRRRVEFGDTDCAGIAHFAVFFRYMEEAEHAFLRSLGLSVRQPQGDGSVIGFPRLSARCEFARSVKFEDVVDIHLWVSRKSKKTIEYSFRFALNGEPVAQGRVVAIACQIQEGRSIRSTAVPPAMNRLLEVAPYPPLAFHAAAPSRSPAEGGGA
ncbi:MAG: acyl-CoA thioesterase [Planctomycetes bacterium]|nr:acyl-CoA thioesterase [Planctomycetota bacterium]